MTRDCVHQNLIARAGCYWSQGEPLPIDLHTEMLSEGLDVAVLEANYQQEQ